MRQEILRIENVSKEIEGITYLDNINFHVFKGEIMGLIPLDSHGKSQLIQLISQNVSIDFGRIYFDEKLVNYYEHSNMTNNKVYIIDKETRLIEDLKVIDNIHVLSHKFDGYIINERRLKDKTDTQLNRLNIHIETDQLVSELSVYEKVVIEMVKAVTNGVQLVILNELSNFLSIEELFDFQKMIRYYAQRGISFLYMANHHEEVFQICHRVCLFEKGMIIKVIEKEDFSDEVLRPYIIPFHKGIEFKEDKGNEGSVEFRDFTTENLQSISFSVSKGECMTLLDINNKGIQDIAGIFSGGIKPIEGHIIIDHKEIETISPHSLLQNRIMFIPENPVDNALFYDMSYLENLTFLMDYKLNKTIISKNILKNIREGYGTLAGDNIDAKDLRNLDKRALYDLVYFRIQLFNPRVVFIMQPFSNADMYLRGRIIEHIKGLKEKGMGVVILAVSISDTLSVSDRLLTMENGKIIKDHNKNYF